MKIIEAPVAQERGGAAKRRRLTMKTRVHAPALETWLPGLLAAALPRLSGALVKDQRGLCVLPGPGVQGLMPRGHIRIEWRRRS